MNSFVLENERFIYGTGTVSRYLPTYCRYGQVP